MFIINNNNYKGVINMNKMKKIGLSALAGSLVAFSANAEITMSGGASVGVTSTNENEHLLTTWLTLLIYIIRWTDGD